MKGSPVYTRFMRRHLSWGVIVFFFALVLTIGYYFTWEKLTDTKILIWSTVGFAILEVVLSHVSYPRVHSLRVTMYGYGIGTTIVLYSLIVLTGRISAEMMDAVTFVVYVVLLLLTLVVVLIPSFVGFRTTMLVSEITVVLVGLAFVVLLVPTPTRYEMAVRLRDLSDPGSLEAWGLAIVSLIIAVLSVLLERDSFGLGGLHSGVVVILAGSWLDMNQTPDRFIGILALLALFLVVAVLAHWLFRVENRASYDPLLRIYNRSYCNQILAGQTKTDLRPPFSIAMIDIDHFKKVNDTYGHDVGDEVLVEIAQRLQGAVVPQGIIARYGGEEMIVFFPHSGIDVVKPIVEEARRIIERTPVLHENRSIPVTVSIGVSTRREKEQKPISVLKSADRALYNAKKGGRNQVRASATRRRKKT